MCFAPEKTQRRVVEDVKLKPCPFCGAPMNLGPNGELIAWHSADCFFSFLDEHEVDMTEEELQDAFISSWNRRAKYV